MKINTIFALQFIAIVSCFGQRGDDPCSRRLYVYTDNPSKEELLLYSNNLDTFISKYVSLKYPDCLGYLTPDKTDLNNIPVNIRFSDLLNFNRSETNNISIRIERKLSTIYADADSLDILAIDEDLAIVNKIQNKPFFGIVQSKANDTIFKVSVIKKIEVIINEDTLRVNHDFFKDLINPNFHNQYKSFRPVEAYYSKSKNLIYIYIFGDFPNPIPDNDYFGQDSSFLCKLIVSPNGETYRIVIPTRFLRYYGWIECENFWGF